MRSIQRSWSCLQRRLNRSPTCDTPPGLWVPVHSIGGVVHGGTALTLAAQIEANVM